MIICRIIIRLFGVLLLPLIVVVVLLPLISCRRPIDFIIAYPLSAPIHETVPQEVPQQISAKGVEQAS